MHVALKQAHLRNVGIAFIRVWLVWHFAFVALLTDCKATVNPDPEVKTLLLTPTACRSAQKLFGPRVPNSLFPSSLAVILGHFRNLLILIADDVKRMVKA